MSAEDQIAVLTSTVNNLKDDKLKWTRALSQKYSDRGRQALNLNTKSEEKEKSYAQMSAQRKEPRHKWMKIPPPPGTPLTKVRDEKTYSWYSHHKAWVCHWHSDFDLIKTPKYEYNSPRSRTK
eukprot:10822421-Ditylum_brightwellii.AAC.1